SRIRPPDWPLPAGARGYPVPPRSSPGPPASPHAAKEHLHQRIALGEQIQILLAKPAPDQRVDQAGERDGQSPRRREREGVLAYPAAEDRGQRTEILLVLRVDLLAEPLTHGEIVARPPGQIEVQDVGVVPGEFELRAHDALE